MDNNKCFLILCLARQVSGEYVFVLTEDAYRTKEKAEEQLKVVSKKYKQDDGKPRLLNIATAQGQAQCICELGIFEVDIKD